jgi:hypothetical protein
MTKKKWHAAISIILLSGVRQGNTNKIFIEGAIGQKWHIPPPSWSTVTCEDSDTSLRVSSGIMLSNTVSLDASYIDFGHATITSNGKEKVGSGFVGACALRE